jgi:hypothetical protein
MQIDITKKDKGNILRSISLILSFIITLLIIYAGVISVKNGDTNGYFMICVGLQFYILRINQYERIKRLKKYYDNRN